MPDIMDDQETKWKVVDGFPNYLISNKGEVYSRSSKKLLKKTIDRGGYYAVCLCTNGNKNGKWIHHLVTSNFIGQLPFGKEINHKDGNKLNNYNFNLEYVTRSENHKHACRIGLRSLRGEDQPRHILKENQVLSIRKLLYGGVTQEKIGKLFGVARSTIGSIAIRKSWRYLNA